MIDNGTASAFFEANHTQGSLNRGGICYGLMHNGEMVSVIQIGKHRFGNTAEYELYRLASLLNMNVVGGASKLLKHFIRQHNPTSIISYADLRWTNSNNSVYEAIGFRRTHRSAPGYFYFRPSSIERLSRQQFQKHKLPKLLEVFNPNLTEWENMQANGYDRIWDCGNDVWLWMS